MWAAGRSRRTPPRGRCRRRKRCGSRDVLSPMAAAMLPSVRLLRPAPPRRAVRRDAAGRGGRVLGPRASRSRPPQAWFRSAPASRSTAALCAVYLGAGVSQQNIPLHHPGTICAAFLSTRALQCLHPLGPRPSLPASLSAQVLCQCARSLRSLTVPCWRHARR